MKKKATSQQLPVESIFLKKKVKTCEEKENLKKYENFPRINEI